jgi:hypothetical protein
MIILAVALACAPKQRPWEVVVERCPDDPHNSAVVPPGSPVPFVPVPRPEGLGVPHDWVPPPPPPGSRAFVEVVASEEAWERFHTSGSAELPSFDFDSVNVFVALLHTSGENRLGITNVWDTGSGTLQVDLTSHRPELWPQTGGTLFAIATVPRGEYVATANLTRLCSDSRPVKR